MKVDGTQRLLLKRYGFKWFKDNCTDRVDAEGIKEILPAANGFTVVYDNTGVLDYSTAVVERIELPDDFARIWILVHWERIEDQRRDGSRI